MIGPSVDMERNIVSKSSAGDAGGVFFVFSFEISRYGTLESMSSRDFRNSYLNYFLGIV